MGHSWSCFRGPWACKEARAVWFSGTWASRRRWDAVKEMRTERGTSGLDLAWGRGGKEGSTLVSPVGESLWQDGGGGGGGLVAGPAGSTGSPPLGD